MSVMKQIFIAMHEDGIEKTNDIARISLKAYQLYNDFEEGRIQGFGERLSALSKEIKDTNYNWNEVKEWLVNWKQAIEENHQYLIVDNLDNCIQVAYDLGFDKEGKALHDGLMEIEINIDELVEA